jgi:AraC-like DNA-binding protein
MEGWESASAWATGAAVATATISLLVLLWRQPKRNADVLFAVVSGSLAISLMRPWVQDAPGWMQWAMAIGGCMTCNGFWLVSRALFRGEGGVGRVPLAVAAGMAAVMVAYRAATWGADAAQTPWASGLGALLTLGSSSLLVLSFLEALRGWSLQLPVAERYLRMAYMMVFGTCVLSTTLAGALVEQGSMPRDARGALIGLCAMAMVLLTHLALWYRHRQDSPMRAGSQSASRAFVTPPPAEVATLAEAVRHHLEVLHVYREPELKVAALAQRIGTAEHKLSRVITQVLGEKNFNQMLNRHRTELACRMLAERDSMRSILDISGDCGFGSLGAFNRSGTNCGMSAGCRTPSPASSSLQFRAGDLRTPTGALQISLEARANRAADISLQHFTSRKNPCSGHIDN